MTDASAASAPPNRLVATAIAACIFVYIIAATAGWPQHGTELTNQAAHHESEAAADGHATEVPAQEETDARTPPSAVMVIPFALLLGAIAIFPLSRVTEHWWESNLHRFYVAAALGVLTLGYYAFAHHHAVDRHFLNHALIPPSDTGASWNIAWTIFQNAIFAEFVPFIVLLFSLYTISGGIRIEGDLPAHPLTNSTFIAIGAVLANLIGTTGAAMLLVRPLLETNSERHHVRHTMVFFIFAVCNCGGCLLPIGDPPLFLGYLQGVDFLWTLKLWPAWLLVNGLLIAIYYVWDHFWCYPHETRSDIARDEQNVRRLRFTGVWPNALLLALVVIAVAVLDPSKPVPGTTWHPWLFLREIVLLGLVCLSLLVGAESVRRANNFQYGAIVEVAALFFGIFLCMQPALQILEVNGNKLGVDLPWEFFWGTGSLSAVLDNAPTYLVFFKAAQSMHAGGAETVAGVSSDVLAAISLGAVFMGAMTYIGNGPNFMVKSIAEKSGVQMPSFFGYMLYSCAILLPLFLLVTFVFLS